MGQALGGRILVVVAAPGGREKDHRKRESVFARREGVPVPGVGTSLRTRLAAGFFSLRQGKHEIRGGGDIPRKDLGAHLLRQRACRQPG